MSSSFNCGWANGNSLTLNTSHNLRQWHQCYQIQCCPESLHRWRSHSYPSECVNQTLSESEAEVVFSVSMSTSRMSLPSLSTVIKQTLLDFPHLSFTHAEKQSSTLKWRWRILSPVSLIKWNLSIIRGLQSIKQYRGLSQCYHPMPTSVPISWRSCNAAVFVTET